MNGFVLLFLVSVILSLGFCRPVVVIEKPKESKTEIYIEFMSK